MNEETRLSLHKLMSDTITAAERRRQQASTFYLTIIAALIALGGSDVGVDKYTISISTIVISLLWLASIRYFRSLSKAKFDVISDLEMSMEYALFQKEWDYFKTKYHKGRFIGLELSTIEMALPTLIGTIAIGFLARSLFLCP